MKIEDIRINKITSEKSGSLVGTAVVTFDSGFVVRMKIINGSKGLFAAWPNYKIVDNNGDARFIDFFYHKEANIAKTIKDAVIKAYNEAPAASASTRGVTRTYPSKKSSSSKERKNYDFDEDEIELK